TSPTTPELAARTVKPRSPPSHSRSSATASSRPLASANPEGSTARTRTSGARQRPSPAKSAARRAAAHRSPMPYLGSMTAHRPLAPGASSRRRAPLRPRAGLPVTDATGARRTETPRNYCITPGRADGLWPAARHAWPTAGTPGPAARAPLACGAGGPGPAAPTAPGAASDGQQEPWPSGAAALAAVPVVPVLAVQAGGVVGHVGLHLARRAYVALGRRARGNLDLRPLHLLVGDGGQQVRDHVDPRAPLVVALHPLPRRLGHVGVHEHLVLGPRVVLPAGDGLQVEPGELPLPERVLQPGHQPLLLLLVADREPVLAEQDAVLHEQSLEDRALVQEPVVLLLGAEPHHVLYPGPVVPAPVEQRDLPARGQVLDVALEVPLGLLSLGRRAQRDDPGDPGIEVLGDPLDGAAFAGRVPALEHHHDPGAL